MASRRGKWYTAEGIPQAGNDRGDENRTAVVLRSSGFMRDGTGAVVPHSRTSILEDEMTAVTLRLN